MTKHILKKEFYELLPQLEKFDVEWVVSSQPEGCPEGYTKVYLKRKRIPRKYQSLRVHLIITECVTISQATAMKKRARELLACLHAKI